MSRAALADAVRPFAPGGRLLQNHIPALNALADALGLPDVAAPPAGSDITALTDQDFIDAANMIGAQYAQVRAVWEIEANGAGFHTDIRADILALDGPGGFIDGLLAKILFEAKVFSGETGGKYDKSHPNISSRTWNRALYVGGIGEWRRLHVAMGLDRQAALKSASWGGPQIMGFNHKLAGFDTVEAFVDAMKSGARAQLLAFVAFIKNSGMADKLRAINGTASSAAPFARAYNGSGYATHNYHGKLAAAFAKWASK